MSLGARTAKLLALAGILASAAAALPGTAAAFNPQPDPPGRTAMPSVTTGEPRQKQVLPQPVGGAGGVAVDARGIRDEENRTVQDSESSATGATGDASSVMIRDSEGPAAGATGDAASVAIQDSEGPAAGATGDAASVAISDSEKVTTGPDAGIGDEEN